MISNFTWDQLTVVLAVIGAVWSMSIWLSSKFSKSADDRLDMKDKIFGWLQTHEDKDQHRHVDNIERFAKIETKLDIVIKNGH